MTLIQNELYVGDDPAEHGIVWASGDPRTEDGLDADQLTEHFRADRDNSGNWVLRNENTDTLITSVHRDTDKITIHTPLRIANEITDDVHFAGEETRISGFDGNEHLIRKNATGSDSILAIQNKDTSDYDLYLYQNGSRARIHTKADDDIDADLVGGIPAEDFGDKTGDEVIEGEWEFDGDLELNRAFFEDQIVLEADDVNTLQFGTGNEASVWLSTDSGNIQTEGDITASGETVLTEETGFIDLADNDETVAETIKTLNFGEGLTVTEDDDIQTTIDWEASDVPSEVYEDGTLIVESADGIDFVDDFNVVENADGNAEVTLQSTNAAILHEDETITGQWLYDLDSGAQIEAPMSFEDPTVDAPQYPMGLSTMGIGRDTDYPGQNIAAMTVRHDENRVLQLGGGKVDDFWLRRYHETDGWTEFNTIWTDQNDGDGSGLDADYLDGKDSDQYGAVDEQETVQEEWKFEDMVDFVREDEFAMRHSGPDHEVYTGWDASDRWGFMPHEGGAWDPNRLVFNFDADRWEFDETPYVDGRPVLTIDDDVVDEDDEVWEWVTDIFEWADEVIGSGDDKQRKIYVDINLPDFSDWTDGDFWFCPEGGDDDAGLYVNIDGDRKVVANLS